MEVFLNNLNEVTKSINKFHRIVKRNCELTRKTCDILENNQCKIPNEHWLQLDDIRNEMEDLIGFDVSYCDYNISDDAEELLLALKGLISIVEGLLFGFNNSDEDYSYEMAMADEKEGVEIWCKAYSELLKRNYVDHNLEYLSRKVVD